MSTTQRVKDRFGRPVTNLRVSLTQGCNQSCLYCHREGQWEPADGEISGEEVVDLIEVAKTRGVEKVKFTGGEPLVRQDLERIIEAVSPGLRDVSLTTNGTMLADRARGLRAAGLDRVNVSLDSLDEDVYSAVTGGSVDDAVAGIQAAVEAGLYPVKVNVVALRGVNDDGDFEDMIEFARATDVILQLIELLDTGEAYFERYHHDLSGVEAGLERRAEKVVRREMHNRAKYFVDGAEVEVVRPVHNPEFCRSCTRLRVTSDGRFKPCLMRDDNLVEVGEDVGASFVEAVKRREPYYC
ncbi:MAG: 7,8-dihydro-6-hydroxymethylpterin dimethyltransferase [Methanonatronarchaeales archaeon]|nr:7,8-dihydro-6-hydroxymethylpterin dimethyltransferase [Methanonatronarchaeales archaeon]